MNKKEYKDFVVEMIIAFVLVCFLVAFLNPYLMPKGMVLYILAVFLILLGCFAGLIWKERGGDERDILLRHISDRYAYLFGLIIVALGICLEIYSTMKVSKWLIISFAGMILTKSIGLIYAKLSN